MDRQDGTSQHQHEPTDYRSKLRLLASSTFMQGRRPSQEDRHVTIPDFCKAGAAMKMPIEHFDKPCSFFAVYDGHQGSKCAEFVAQRLHSRLLARLSAYKGYWDENRLRETLRESFHELDKEFLQKHRTDPDGCTAVLALIMGTRLVVAWVGDSRAVAGVRQDARDKNDINASCSSWQTIQVSEDHKPNLPQERERVGRAGGVVIKLGGCYRVAAADFEAKTREIKRAKAQGLGTIAKDPVALAVSRSFGDRFFKEPKPLLVATPSVRVATLEKKHKFLVLMCDGITDVMSDQQVVETIQSHAQEGARASVGALVKHAYGRMSQDNLTALVVFFSWEGDNWKIGADEAEEPPAKRPKGEKSPSDDAAEKRTATPETNSTHGGSGESAEALKIPRDRGALAKLSAKELKALLIANRVDVVGCCEKSDFLEKAKVLVDKAGATAATEVD